MNCYYIAIGATLDRLVIVKTVHIGTKYHDKTTESLDVRENMFLLIYISRKKTHYLP